MREEVEERIEVEGATPDKALAAARVVDSCAAVESAPVTTGVEDGAPGRGLAAYLSQEYGRAVAATLGWNMVRLE